MLGNFGCFKRLLILFRIKVFKKILSGITFIVSNSLDPDQAGHCVRPDLGPNGLQRLSSDDTSWQIIKRTYLKITHFFST